MVIFVYSTIAVDHSYKIETFCQSLPAHPSEVVEP